LLSFGLDCNLLSWSYPFCIVLDDIRLILMFASQVYYHPIPRTCKCSPVVRVRFLCAMCTSGSRPVHLVLIPPPRYYYSYIYCKWFTSPYLAISVPNVTVLAKAMWLRCLSVKRKVYDTDCGTAAGPHPRQKMHTDVGWAPLLAATPFSFLLSPIIPPLFRLPAQPCRHAGASAWFSPSLQRPFSSSQRPTPTRRSITCNKQAKFSKLMSMIPLSCSLDHT